MLDIGHLGHIPACSAQADVDPIWDPSGKVFLKAQRELSVLLLSRQCAAVLTAGACTRLAAAHAMRRPLRLALTHIMLLLLPQHGVVLTFTHCSYAAACRLVAAT